MREVEHHNTLREYVPFRERNKAAFIRMFQSAFLKLRYVKMPDHFLHRPQRWRRYIRTNYEI